MADKGKVFYLFARVRCCAGCFLAELDSKTIPTDGGCGRSMDGGFLLVIKIKIAKKMKLNGRTRERWPKGNN